MVVARRRRWKLLRLFWENYKKNQYGPKCPGTLPVLKKNTKTETCTSKDMCWKVFIKENDDKTDHLEARPRAKTMTHYNHVFCKQFWLAKGTGFWQRGGSTSTKWRHCKGDGSVHTIWIDIIWYASWHGMEWQFSAFDPYHLNWPAFVKSIINTIFNWKNWLTGGRDLEPQNQDVQHLSARTLFLLCLHWIQHLVTDSGRAC